MSRNRYLRTKHPLNWGAVPAETVPRTEHEETRRAARDWLRERDESNAEFWVADDQWDGE